MTRFGSGRMRLIKVLIADGSMVSRLLIEGLLTDAADFRVVASVTSLTSVLDLAEELRPDILLMDLTGSGEVGPKLLTDLHKLPALKRAVLFAEPIDDELRQLFEQLGSQAFFDKNTISDDAEAFRDSLRAIVAHSSLEAHEQFAQSVEEHSDTSANIATLLPRNQVPIGPELRSGGLLFSSGISGVHEAERLEAIYALGVNDARIDRRLDLIAQHLCQVTDYPMAAVTFIDDTVQWMKGASGLAPMRLPREQTICTHLISCPAPLIITDTLQHPDFSTLPCVTGEPHVRAYVGAPLVVERGLPVGAICLMDTQPRSLVQRELVILTNIAELTMEVLDRSAVSKAA